MAGFRILSGQNVQNKKIFIFIDISLRDYVADMIQKITPLKKKH